MQGEWARLRAALRATVNLLTLFTIYMSVPRERLIGVGERLELSQYVRAKPYLRVLIPGIVGSVIEFMFTASLGSIALRNAAIDANQYGTMLTRTRDDINARLTVIGHRIWFSTVSAQPGQYAVLNVYIQNANGSTTWGALENYTFDPYPDVEWAVQNYAESEQVAKARLAEYAQTLTVETADQILDAAAAGYAEFMGTATAKHVIAALKHAMRLGMVDRQYYIQRLQQGIEQNFKLDPEAYRHMAGAVLRALDGAVKLIIDYARNR